MKTADQLMLAWFGLTNLWAFLLFGWDKFRSSRTGSRVSEFNLALIGALGGWPGGLLGMLVFRHKTAKSTFKLKYAAAFCVWIGLVYACLRFR